jgi:hypothetical protein
VPESRFVWFPVDKSHEAEHLNHYFMGFGYAAILSRTPPRIVGAGIEFPWWFPALICAVLLLWIWRREPRKQLSAFPLLTDDEVKITPPKQNQAR